MGRKLVKNPLLPKGFDIVEEDSVTGGVDVIGTPSGPVTADSTGKVSFTGDGITIVPNGPFGVAFKADAKALEIEASGNLILPDNGRWKLLSSDGSVLPRKGTQPGELDIVVNPQTVPSVLPGSNIQAHQIPSFTGKGNELTSSVATVSPDGNIGAKDISAGGDIQGTDISSLGDITATGRVASGSLEATNLGDPINQHESVVVTDANGKLKRITLGDQSFVSKEGKEIVQTILSASDGIEIVHSFDTNTKLSERTIRPLGFLKSLYNMSKVSALKSGFVVLRSDGTAQAVDLIAGNGIEIDHGDGSDPSGTRISVSPAGGLKNSEYGVAIVPTEDRTFGGLGNNAILNWPVTTIHANGIAFNVDPTYGWLFENTMGDGFYIFNVNLRFFSTYATTGIKEAPISVITNILNPDNTVSNRLVRDLTFSGNSTSANSELLNSLDTSDVLYLHSKQKVYITVDMSAATSASDINSVGVNGTLNTLTYNGYYKTYVSLVPILGAGASNPAQQADVGCIVTLTQDELPPTPISNITHITKPYAVRYTKDVTIENDPANGWTFKASSIDGLYSINGELAFEANFTQSTGTETISVDVYLVHEDNTGTVINKWMISHHPLSRPLTPTLTQVFASVPISTIFNMHKGDSVYFELTISPPAAQASGAVVSLAGRSSTAPETERTFIAFTKHSSGSQGGDGDVISSVTAPVTIGSIPVFDDPAGKVISNTEVTIDSDRNISNVKKLEADEADLSVPLDITSGGTGASILPEGVVISDGSILDTVDALVAGHVLTAKLDSQGNMTYDFERPAGGISSDTSDTDVGDIPVYDSTDGTKITKSQAKITGGTLSGIDELDGPLSIKGTVTLRDTPGRQADLDIERGNLNVNGITKTTALNVSGDSVLSGGLTVSSLPSPGGTSDSPNSIATLDHIGRLQRFDLHAQDSFLARHDGDLMQAAFANDPDGSIRFTSKVIGPNALYSFVADGLLASIHSLGKRILSKQAQPGLIAVQADGTATSIVILGARGISVTTSESSAGKTITVALSVLRDSTNGSSVVLSPARSVPLTYNIAWYLSGIVNVRFKSAHVEFTGDNDNPWQFKAKTDGVYYFSSVVMFGFDQPQSGAKAGDAYLRVFVEVTRDADQNNKELYKYEEFTFYDTIRSIYRSVSVTEGFYLNVNDYIRIKIEVFDQGVTLPNLIILGSSSTTPNETQYTTRASLLLTAPNIATSSSTGAFGGITPGSGAVATPDTVNDRIGLIGEGIVNTYTKTGDANNVYAGTTGTAQNQIFGVGDATASPNFIGKAFNVLGSGLVSTSFSGGNFNISTSAYSASLDAINGTNGFVYSDGTALSARQIDVLPQGIATLDTTTNPPQLKFTGRLPSLEALPSNSNGVLKVNSNGVGLVEQPMGPQTNDSVKILTQVGDDPKFRYLRFPSDGLWAEVDKDGNVSIKLSHHLLELEDIPDSATGLLWKDNTSNTFHPVNLVGGTNVSVDSSQLRTKGIITINAAGGGGDLPPSPIIPIGNELPDPNPSSASYAGLVFNADSVYDDTQEDEIPVSINGKDVSVKYIRSGCKYRETGYSTRRKSYYAPSSSSADKLTDDLTVRKGLYHASNYERFSGFNGSPSIFANFKPIPAPETKGLGLGNYSVQYGIRCFTVKTRFQHGLPFIDYDGFYQLKKIPLFYYSRQFSGKTSLAFTFFSKGYKGRQGTSKSEFKTMAAAFAISPGFTECIATGSSKLNYYSLSDVSSGVSSSVETINLLNSTRQFSWKVTVGYEDDLVNIYSIDTNTFNESVNLVCNYEARDATTGNPPKTDEYYDSTAYSLLRSFKECINWFTIPSDGMYVIRGRMVSNGSSIGVLIVDNRDTKAPYSGKSKTRSYELCSFINTLNQVPASATLPAGTRELIEKAQFYFNKGEMIGFFSAYNKDAITEPYDENIHEETSIYRGSSVEIEQIAAGSYSPINEKIPGSNEFTSNRWMQVELNDLVNISQPKSADQNTYISTYKIDGFKSVIGKLTPAGQPDIINANGQIVSSGAFSEEIYAIYLQMDIKMNMPISDLVKLPTRCMIGINGGTTFEVSNIRSEVRCIHENYIHIFFNFECAFKPNVFESIYIVFEDQDEDFTWTNKFNENGIVSVKPTLLVYDTGKHINPTPSNPIPEDLPDIDPYSDSYIGLEFKTNSLTSDPNRAVETKKFLNNDTCTPFYTKGVKTDDPLFITYNDNLNKDTFSVFSSHSPFNIPMPVSVFDTRSPKSIFAGPDNYTNYWITTHLVLRFLLLDIKSYARGSITSARGQLTSAMTFAPGFYDVGLRSQSKSSFYGLSSTSSGHFIAGQEISSSGFFIGVDLQIYVEDQSANLKNTFTRDVENDLNYFKVPSSGIYILSGSLICDNSGNVFKGCYNVLIIPKECRALDANGVSIIKKTRNRHVVLCSSHSSIDKNRDGGLREAGISVCEEKIQMYLEKDDWLLFMMGVDSSREGAVSGATTPSNLDLSIYHGSYIEMEQISSNYAPLVERFPDGETRNSSRWMSVNLSNLDNVSQAYEKNPTPYTQKLGNPSTYNIDSYASIIGKSTPTGEADIINDQCQIVTVGSGNKVYDIYLQMDVFIKDTGVSDDDLPTQLVLEAYYISDPDGLIVSRIVPCGMLKFYNIFFVGSINVDASASLGPIGFRLKFIRPTADFVWTNNFTQAQATGTVRIDSVAPKLLVCEYAGKLNQGPDMRDPNPDAPSYAGLVFDDDSVYTGTKDSSIPVQVGGTSLSLDYASKGCSASNYAVNKNGLCGHIFDDSSYIFNDFFKRVVPTFNSLSILDSLPAADTIYFLSPVIQAYVDTGSSDSPNVYVADGEYVGKLYNDGSSILRSMSGLVKSVATLNVSGKKAFISFIPGFKECSAATSSKLSYYGLSDVTSGVSGNIKQVSIFNVNTTYYYQGTLTPLKFTGNTLLIKFTNFTKDSSGQTPLRASDLFDNQIYNFSEIPEYNINWFTAPSDGIYILSGRIISNRTDSYEAHIVASIVDTKDSVLPFVGPSRSKNITLCRRDINDDNLPPSSNFDRTDRTQIYLKNGDRIGFFIGTEGLPASIKSFSIYRGTSVEIEHVSNDYLPLEETISRPTSYTPRRWMHVDLGTFSFDGTNLVGSEFVYTLSGYSSVIGKDAPQGDPDIINQQCQIVHTVLPNRELAFQLKLDIKILKPNGTSGSPMRCSLGIGKAGTDIATNLQFSTGCMNEEFIHIFARGLFSLPVDADLANISIIFSGIDGTEIHGTNNFSDPFVSTRAELLVYETNKTITKRSITQT